MSNRTETSNPLGQVYDLPRKKIGSISELKCGDHIAFKGFLYSHHAIIESIDTQKEKCTIIEYTNGTLNFSKNFSISSPYKAKVTRSIKDFKPNKIWLIIHDKSDDVDTILKRATERLGENDYNFVKRNCEHFANYCITGTAYCEQVGTAAQNAGLFGGKAAAEAAKGAIVFAGTKIGARVGIEVVVRFGAVVGHVAGGVISAGVELVFMGIDIKNTVDKKKEGKINQRQFDDAIGKRVGVGATSVTGGVAGSVIGQIVIPIPFLGLLVGGALGGLLGLGVGSGLGETGVKIRDAIEKKSEKYRIQDSNLNVIA